MTKKEERTDMRIFKKKFLWWIEESPVGEEKRMRIMKRADTEGKSKLRKLQGRNHPDRKIDSQK